eukprot:48179-Rhodomonas_salina.2
MKFYEDPQLNIQDAQTKICRTLCAQWGIPETHKVRKGAREARERGSEGARERGSEGARE